ncbi:glucose-methanol-choline (GMC) oxidoreductase family protein [Actinidia rufa]|uniref:Glucose-methanol-choline (GMC) oxidoreductase family protein n=1 Tax=Actinidia rufa TaxID=165716 RepID=A0A7J0GBD2_9ERIC|nr:glucose-methanol-choline (GMC) oxidoreductase family protein [Actinidia rufa]
MAPESPPLPAPSPPSPADPFPPPPTLSLPGDPPSTPFFRSIDGHWCPLSSYSLNALLSVMAVIRLDDGSDNIEDNDRRPPLSTSTWQEVGGTIFNRFGHQHTAAELLASTNPEKLDVLVHATVRKIVFDTTELGNVQFREETKSSGSDLQRRKRQQTPSISCQASGERSNSLIRSHWQPPATNFEWHWTSLQKLNLSVMLHNELVGKGMSDNPLNSIFVPTNKPVKQSLIQTVGISKFGVYIEARSGFGQSQDSIRCNHGILSAEIGQLSTIPPKQRSHTSLQQKQKRAPYEAFKGGFILEKIARPISRGHLSLLNTDVDDNPSITFNYFSHPSDLRRCVHGIRTVEKVLTSKHFTSFAQCDHQTLDRLLNLSVQANVNLIPKHTNDSVFGTVLLRVIDGLTFHESPGTNPQTTVMMLGRYMGAKILRERLRRSAVYRKQRPILEI